MFRLRSGSVAIAIRLVCPVRSIGPILVCYRSLVLIKILKSKLSCVFRNVMLFNIFNIHSTSSVANK